MMFKKEKIKMSDRIIEKIKNKIHSGEWKVGEAIPNEAELMALFNTGRSTIRESVKVLSGEGYLFVKQGHGTFVEIPSIKSESLDSRLSRSNILEVYEIRRMLELEIAKLAAERRTEFDLSIMKKALENRKIAKKNNDKEGYVKNDVVFHTAIAAACKNNIAFDLYKSFSSALQKAMKSYVHDEELYKDQIDIHEKILKAIEDKDAEKAVYWTEKNIEITTYDLIELLK